MRKPHGTRASNRKPHKVLPYSTQTISEADIRAVERVLRSSHLTQGPAIERFEKALAKKAGTKYAVALNSGTAALHAAYFAAGIGAGDEVIVPSITFAATANAALYLGAKPVFADSDPETGLIDVTDVAEKITDKTKAIVCVDYAGRPCDFDALRDLAKKRRLVLIDDGAQSLGARYHGRPVGAQADMTTFSFHPVKSITTGEGGAVVTNDAQYAHAIRLFRTHGITKDPKELADTSAGAWFQEQHVLGYNYRMTEMQAALGESQLKCLDSFMQKRRALASRYRKLLKDVPGISLPPDDTGVVRSAWHVFVVQVGPAKRRQIFDGLREKGIGAQVHHIPVYWHPYYQKLGYRKRLCPKAESLYAGAISIPLYPSLSKKEQDFVVTALKAALS